MIPAHNCAVYLRQTLESILVQDPGSHEMQIEVLDDASSDDPGTVVRELGAGRIGFHRHDRRVGHVANFNDCILRSRGQLVHILHGDDAVRPGFYEALGKPFDDLPDVGAAFCRYISMGSSGHWESVGKLEQESAGVLSDWLERIAVGQRLQTPCMVVRRETYEVLGGYDTRLPSGEDWEMWVRIAARFPVWYEPAPLALYRVHRSSITGDELRTGSNVRSLRDVIEINRPALPRARADAITRRALEDTAVTAIRRAIRLLHAGEPAAARSQVREALRTSRTPAVVERLAYFGVVWARRAIRQRAGGWS
jgi:glycosyltransferase involved in cell wall biosynthesis